MNHKNRNLISNDVAPANHSEKGRSPSSLLVTIPVRDETKTPPTKIGRRSALKLMAASTLLAAGTPGCNRKPYRKIISMVDLPEYQRPGVPVHFASTWTQGRVPYGMMVKTVDGRPIKIEGLPDHPLNHGATNAQMQASVLSLYDPERLRDPLKNGEVTTWEIADTEIAASLKTAKSVLLITPSSLGPSECSIIDHFLKACAAAKRMVWESQSDQTRRSAWNEVYGADGEVRPKLASARVIISLGADFLGTDGDSLELTHDFAKTRRLVTGETTPESLSRLYVVESAMTVTGSNADHRIALRPSSIASLVAAMRKAIGGDTAELKQFADEHHTDERLLEAMVTDLQTHKGEAVVLAGSHLPSSVHAAVCLLNSEIHAPGNTLTWNASPANQQTDDISSFRALAEADAAIDVLIFLGVNAAHDWQPEVFRRIVDNSKLTVGCGLHLDETLSACTFSLPSTHNLESWNDRAPLEGISSLCQPMIAPIYRGRQEAESLLRWTQSLATSDAELAAVEDWHHYVKLRWEREVLDADQDKARAWEDALRAGFVGQAGKADFPSIDVAKAETSAQAERIQSDGYELVILPHHALVDGRFASNAWLHELPDPISKLVWDNAAILGPSTAEQLGVAENDLLAIEYETGSSNAKKLTLPVLVQPGVAQNVIVTTLGHGREKAGPVGTDVGVNVAPLIGNCGTSLTSHLAVDIQVSPQTREAGASKTKLVRTQKTFSMMDRPIVRHGTLDEYKLHPDFSAHRSHVPPLEQLDEPHDYSQGSKWAMAIDLNSCTGCSGCTIACQAENNIPVVGRDQCDHGRSMHWIRIDRYEQFEEGSTDDPHVYQQPMLCQHCDNAPCENVCPVNATAHSEEGLNEQAYNRCVGTRYCANNCPYKVRNFNFFNYQDLTLKDDVQELVFNPQVTVRSRGVMEKCTFCVQRINEVKFQKKNSGEQIPDGAIKPACAQSCPAQAIVFGDLNDPNSEIVKRKNSPLAYHVLEELNVRPNVSYMARVNNPHPHLPKKSAGGHS